MSPKFFLSALIALAFIIGVPKCTIGQGASTNEWADTVANDYEVVPNITYTIANNSEQKLDLYLPHNRSNPVPTLIFIHGGGWVEGKKEYDVLQLLPYLSLGFAVVNVEYRLGRNSLAPAAVEDCRCALRWVYRHAKENGLDTTKIVLTGGSAGGHLALITGMLPPSNVFDRGCSTDDSVRWTTGTESEMKVAAIINWFGITDVEDLLAGQNAKHYAIEWFGSLNNREQLARQISPINLVRAGLPPVLTIHGDSDDLVPYSHAVRLHAALDKAGVMNQLITIRGGKHGGFGRQDTLNNFASIREFLRKNGILK